MVLIGSLKSLQNYFLKLFMIFFPFCSLFLHLRAEIYFKTYFRDLQPILRN